jgi:Protein of unknown function (DUF3120)
LLTSSTQSLSASAKSFALNWPYRLGNRKSWAALVLASFLVSIPVFVQAPLVRALPWVSLSLTSGWIALAYGLRDHTQRSLWSDVLVGFSGSWLAGSLYWGWFRQEPLLHLPIEALFVPLALWALAQRRFQAGAWFYLGSLWGTAITDIYFYRVHLIPYWRQVMQVDFADAMPILQEALTQMQTFRGMGWAVLLILVLCMSGLFPFLNPSMRKGEQLPQWIFAGAVLSTLLVDGLFWLTVQQI